MLDFFVFLLAKAARRLQLSSRWKCSIHSTSALMSGGQYYDVRMGRYSYAGYGCRVTRCDIGAFCSIADHVMIGGAEHPIKHVSSSPVFHEGRNILGKVFFPHSYEPGKTTIIGNDVWIGFGAKIKSGVRIGDGAVIGMGSIVTHDIPPYEIWGGNPARMIKKRFDDKVRDALLSIKWWDMPEEEIRKKAYLFSDIEEFLNSEMSS